MLFDGNVTGVDDRIFRSARGLVLNESHVSGDIERICKKAGVTKFTPHAFRDTFATRAIESGMNPKTLQEILGHSDIGMTMNLYAHVMEETKEKEMSLVEIKTVLNCCQSCCHPPKKAAFSAYLRHKYFGYGCMPVTPRARTGAEGFEPSSSGSEPDALTITLCAKRFFNLHEATRTLTARSVAGWSFH